MQKKKKKKEKKDIEDFCNETTAHENKYNIKLQVESDYM